MDESQILTNPTLNLGISLPPSPETNIENEEASLHHDRSDPDAVNHNHGAIRTTSMSIATVRTRRKRSVEDVMTEENMGMAMEQEGDGRDAVEEEEYEQDRMRDSSGSVGDMVVDSMVERGVVPPSISAMGELVDMMQRQQDVQHPVQEEQELQRPLQLQEEVGPSSSLEHITKDPQEQEEQQQQQLLLQQQQHHHHHHHHQHQHQHHLPQSPPQQQPQPQQLALQPPPAPPSPPLPQQQRRPPKQSRSRNSSSSAGSSSNKHLYTNSNNNASGSSSSSSSIGTPSKPHPIVLPLQPSNASPELTEAAVAMALSAANQTPLTGKRAWVRAQFRLINSPKPQSKSAYYACIHCDTPLAENVTRFGSHLISCRRTPPQVAERARAMYIAASTTYTTGEKIAAAANAASAVTATTAEVAQATSMRAISTVSEGEVSAVPHSPTAVITPTMTTTASPPSASVPSADAASSPSMLGDGATSANGDSSLMLNHSNILNDDSMISATATLTAVAPSLPNLSTLEAAAAAGTRTPIAPNAVAAVATASIPSSPPAKRRRSNTTTKTKNFSLQATAAAGGDGRGTKTTSKAFTKRNQEEADTNLARFLLQKRLDPTICTSDFFRFFVEELQPNYIVPSIDKLSSLMGLDFELPTNVTISEPETITTHAGTLPPEDSDNVDNMVNAISENPRGILDTSALHHHQHNHHHHL